MFFLFFLPVVDDLIIRIGIEELLTSAEEIESLSHFLLPPKGSSVHNHLFFGKAYKEERLFIE